MYEELTPENDVVWAWNLFDVIPPPLITAGTGAANQQTRIFEVARDDGAVVWEIRMPARTGSYRAQRVWPRPLLRDAR
jgi:hypothetical protein